MNQILSSLKQSFKIKDRKLLFLLLFFLQVGFLALIIYIFIHYYIIIIELLSTAIENMSRLSTDTLANTQQNIILYANLRNVSKNFLIAIVIAYLAYVLINGLNWDFTNFLTGKKLLFPIYEVQFAVLAFIFLLPAMIIIKIIINSLISLRLTEPIQIMFYLVLSVTWYFMMISFALINKYNLNQLKQHLKQTFIIGYKKAKILVPTFLIIIAVLSAFLCLIYFLQDSAYLSITLLSIIIFIIVLIWTRIYFLTTMKNIC